MCTQHIKQNIKLKGLKENTLTIFLLPILVSQLSKPLY